MKNNTSLDNLYYFLSYKKNEEAILTDDAFFNRNWAGACGSRWVGQRLLVG